MKSSPAPADHTRNEEIERGVLGSVLSGRWQNAWETILEIIGTPAAFYGRDHRIIAVACQQLAGEGAVIDSGSVSACLASLSFLDVAKRLHDLDGLPGRLPKLPEDSSLSYDDSALQAIGGYASDAISGQPGTFGDDHLRKNARIIADHYRQRQAIAIFSSAVDSLRRPQGVREVGEIVDSTLNLAMSQTKAGGASMLVDGADQAIAQHDEIVGGAGQRCAKFGLHSIDRIAPLRPGQLWVLAAAPKCGKTSLLLHAITSTAKEYGPRSVAAVSCEMSNQELATVLIARRLRCAVDQVKDGRLDKGQREQANLIRTELGELGVDVRDVTDGCTVHDVATWTQSRKRMHPQLSLLVIDYLQLLNRTHRAQNEYECVSEATKRLKQLARYLRLPILLLSQMNRDGRKQDRGRGGVLMNSPRPQLSDLRGSGSIEQDADGVIFLWKPDSNTQIVRAEIAANRSGPTGHVDLLWYPAQGQRFAEIRSHQDGPVEEEEPAPHSTGTTRHDRMNNPREGEADAFTK